MSRSFRSICTAALLMVLASATLGIASAAEPAIPDVLSDWVDWVLDDQDQRACPLGSTGDGSRICAWPGRLRLEIDDTGGRFQQQWTVQADAWVPLPGGDAQWPQQVSSGDRALAVVEQGGRPAVRLKGGQHLLTGGFVWPRRPELLAIPAETGLLALRLDGAEVATPRLDDGGRLWLGGGARSSRGGEPDSLMIEVTRRIDDEVPLQVRTRLALEVSGQTREVRLGPIMLPGGIPLRIDSPLPARLLGASGEPVVADDVSTAAVAGGMLQVQLRPGRWELTLDSHHAGPVDALTLDSHAAPWPEQEVWVFSARPALRQVEVTGADLVDPRQTRLPADWQQLPAYLMRTGMTLRLEQLRRGASGADRVRLDRTLWLDFAGDAFSVRDRLSGTLEQRWRLEAEPVLRLGQVRVDKQSRFITRLSEDDPLQGVEVRRGRLELSADARIDSGPVGWRVDLPSSGWTLPLDGAATRLNLPPGWDLLAVDGVDNLPNTWLARWSLLDLFLVLVAALAIGRLWGWHWGLLALLTLVLTWQEPGAPRWIWLHVLAAAALLRVLPAASADDQTEAGGVRDFRRLRMLLQVYYRGALLLLALIALPFLVTEMRDGLFPQLDRQGAGLSGMLVGSVPGMVHAPAAPAADEAANRFDRGLAEAEAVTELSRRKQAGLSAPVGPRPLPTLDPDARLQTGAGVPDWTWRSFTLSWSGPVPADHQLRLWLLPPWAALLLAVGRLLLVLMLGLRLANLVPASRAKPRGALASAAGLTLCAVLLVQPDVGLAQPMAAADQADAVSVGAAAFPPAELLDSLKQRLLEPPDCLPRCVEIPRMVLDASAAELRLLLAVDAAEAVALPVPGSRDGWLPVRVELDGQPLDGLRGLDDGGLIVPVPAGRHLLLLAGPLPRVDQLDLPLPLKPRLLEATLDPAWRLDGVGGDGRPGDQLRLLRQRAADSVSADTEPTTEQRALPPLLRVTRTLRFGLDWSVDTEVQRLSPAASAVTLRVSLIPGEAVTSAGIQVDDAGVLVSLPPGRQRMRWSSALKPVDRLTLTAADDPRLSEQWRLQVSPLWHLSFDGVPPVQNLGSTEQWLPAWRPWPGERLELLLSRPLGVPGSTLTLDRSRYLITPGRRASEAELSLTLRSSQGGRHRLRLPADAELTRLSIDGQQRPLALQGSALDLPLVPGSQQIVLGWREPSRMQAVFEPALVELGTAGVNAETRVQLGAARWVLWTAGPGIGPAVLFWALLAVLLVLAAVLARSRVTPLGFIDWLLLGIGLSQVGVWVGALVAIWLFALGLRHRWRTEVAAWHFNLVQLGLVLLSIAALLALLVALQQGLLGSPEMQIAGNGSSATSLNWYLDRQGPETVPVTVVSAPIWVYRALMLAWALWLAWRLLGWLRWGWRGLSEPTLWRPSRSGRPTAGNKAARERDGLSLDI